MQQHDHRNKQYTSQKLRCELQIVAAGMDLTGLTNFSTVLFKLSLNTQDNQHNCSNYDQKHKQQNKAHLLVLPPHFLA